MQITFNTGRQYTSRGQIITAKFDPVTGKVWFNDHSRMVDGGFTVSGSVATLSLLWKNNPEGFARAVMRHYDAGGTYNIPTEDWKIARDLRESDTVLTFRI